MTLGEWLESAPIPRLEAQILAADILQVDRSWIIAHPEVSVENVELDAVLARRIAGEPLPYIIGYREFYGRKFLVDPRVLIPRQETEILIEMFLDTFGSGVSPLLRVADIGTGSGCIAITVALECPELEITGIDLSSEALEVAWQNGEALISDSKAIAEQPQSHAKQQLARKGPLKINPKGGTQQSLGLNKAIPQVRIRLSEHPEGCATEGQTPTLNSSKSGGTPKPQVRFVCGDGIEWLAENSVDVILTNPPYVGLSDELGQGVTEFEPHQALFAGESGLAFYQRLADCPWTGDLFCEIGMGQGDAVRSLFKPDEFINARNDLSGIERVLHFRRRGTTKV